MNNSIQHELARQRQQELLHQAQHLALIKSIHTAKPHTRKSSRAFYAPKLARLGNWLVQWGAYLQTHYAEAHATQTLITLENPCPEEA